MRCFSPEFIENFTILNLFLLSWAQFKNYAMRIILFFFLLKDSTLTNSEIVKKCSSIFT